MKKVMFVVTVLVCGVVLFGCQKSIDGTWVDIDDNSVKYIFDNGNFEFIAPGIVSKGTYTVKGKNLTLIETSYQYDGGSVNEIDEGEYMPYTGAINGDVITFTSSSEVDDEGKPYIYNYKKKIVVSGGKALVGTWEGAMGITWTFDGKKFTQSFGGVKQSVPYKIKGNTISTEYQGAEVEMEFEVDGDTLTIEVMGFDMEFERVK